MDAGGWNSLEMPMHYIAAETIANEGVKDPSSGRSMRKVHDHQNSDTG